jgi:hypothetical protein
MGGPLADRGVRRADLQGPQPVGPPAEKFEQFVAKREVMGSSILVEQ